MAADLRDARIDDGVGENEPITQRVPLDLLTDAIQLLRECAEDLRTFVEREYPEQERANYPTYRRRFERDIGPVERAENVVRKLESLRDAGL